jgi:hypothetical protein
VLVRSVGAPRATLLRAAALALVVGGLAVALGPARPLVDSVRYTAESAVLSTRDASSSQRTAELENFTRNLEGVPDVLFGKGLGAVWNAEVDAPIEIAAFGSDETPYVRVGWHVYGLDWLYKLGALGVIAGLALLVHAALIVRRAVRRSLDPALRSIVISLAVLAPVLLLLAFTNARIAFFAGVTAALVSKVVDLARPEPSREAAAGG